jgi:Calcium binding
MAKKKHDKDKARLNELIEEATVDCYDAAEEHMGLVNMVIENVVCPFKATIIDEEVEVVELREPERGLGLEAVCRYKSKDYRIDIGSLQWLKQKPEGFEWIEAYQLWRSRRG